MDIFGCGPCHPVKNGKYLKKRAEDPEVNKLGQAGVPKQLELRDSHDFLHQTDISNASL